MPLKPKATETTTVSIPSIEVDFFDLPLIGDSSLVCHQWSDKAKKQMLDKQMGTAKQAKEKKDPERDYQDSLYHIEGGGYGFPSVAFKSAAVSACRFSEGMKMTEARGAFHVVGELTEILGTPQRRDDMVRVGMGTADIRYRGEFKKWGAILQIRYNVNVLTRSQIVNLFNLAGFGVGVGEGRPEKNRDWGMFHVASTDEIRDLMAEVKGEKKTVSRRRAD